MTITDAMPNGLAKKKRLLIEMDALFNPLTMSERDFWTTLSSPGQKGKKYSIEEGYTAFQAKEPTTIKEVEITSTDTTV